MPNTEPVRVTIFNQTYTLAATDEPGERRRPVDLGLPLAQQIEVGPREQQDRGHQLTASVRPTWASSPAWPGESTAAERRLAGVPAARVAVPSATVIISLLPTW